VLGCGIILCALTDVRAVLLSRLPVLLYAAASLGLLGGAGPLVKQAPLRSRAPFRGSMVLLAALVYFMLRFHPRVGLAAGWLWPVDWLAALAITAPLVGLVAGTLRGPENAAAKMAVVGSVLAFATVCAYPVQLAVGGQEWIDCVVDRYPDQGMAFSVYVYCATSVIFAAIGFLTTLLTRRIITETEMAAITVLQVVGILFAMVVSQELHLWQTSTQKLYIPCVAPQQPWLRALEKALDTSTFARRLLRYFGADIPLS